MTATEFDRIVQESSVQTVENLQRQLDSARGWACHYHQKATEYGRRVNLALAYVDEIACDCDDDMNIGQGLLCAKHELEAILRGDE